MEQYYFLFVLTLVWIVAAVVQDLRKTEVPNWLTFSLIAFALAYRAFYSLYLKDLEFFLYGFAGLILFCILANAFYYGRVFAGGDAKLMMGIGVVLPFEKPLDYFILGGGFILALFLVGAIYSLIYSFFIAAVNWKVFKKEFAIAFWKYRHGFYFALLAALILAFLIKYLAVLFGVLVFYGLILHLVVIDKCMVRMTPYNRLNEGDWLVSDVDIKGKKIRKSVHGLSLEEIAILRGARKSVLVRLGIPFTPAFLFAFAIMVYAFLAQLAFPYFFLS